ncbi:MAG: hypothetical protein HKN33_04590 [Pyrinomonadaceae bacterium]|nr:hypothetical protein [Pyrinomonadaceae bacterium]
MSVKKTGSPFTSGAEPLEPLGSKESKRTDKAEGSFESALADLEGQMEQVGRTSDSGSTERSALGSIASDAQLDTPEGAFGAVKESAGFLVKSRLTEEFLESEQGKKVADDISEFIARDPFMHKKLLGILQRLKEA